MLPEFAAPCPSIMAEESEDLVESLVVHRMIETMDFKQLEELLLDPEAREGLREEDEEVSAGSISLIS